MKNTFRLATHHYTKVLFTLLVLVFPVSTIGAQEPSFPDTVPAPTFSLPRGLYEETVAVSLNCADTVASIYFTTDGSVPGPENGYVYRSPLYISSTTPLRAIAMRKGPQSQVLTSPVATSTYIQLRDVYNQPNNPTGYPSVWGKYAQIKNDTAIADYEMDPELMESEAYKTAVKESLKELPIVSLVTDKNHLFSLVEDELSGGIYIFTGPPTGGPGKGWERPASFEFILPGDSGSLQADCGLQLHGGHCRLPDKCPKHSFRLDFQNEYGLPKLPYPLFGPGGTPEVNSFFLRAGFGYTWVHQNEAERSKAIYTRDRWAKATQLKMGYVSGRGLYAHLFINGMYWGLYNPTERIDDDFCKAYLGGKKSEWDVIKVGEPVQVAEATEGDLKAWERLMAMADTAAYDPVVYNKLQGLDINGQPDSILEPLLDVDNFIDYMLINFYGSNSDWDRHNWIAIRNRVQPGKGFQFLCWDSEQLLKTLDGNVLSVKNKNCPSYLFQQLRKNPAFLQHFAQRVSLHCYNNGVLSPSGALSTFKALADPIDNALYAEAARWGDYRRDVHPYTTKGKLYRKEVDYDANRAWMETTYFPERTGVFLKQLQAAGLFDLANALDSRPAIFDMNVKVAPQPFGTELTLLFALPALSKVSLRVFDPAGRLVWQVDAGWMSEGLHTWALSAPDLAPGTYIGRLTATGSQSTNTLFKLHKAP
jgi:hypothetical protein